MADSVKFKRRGSSMIFLRCIWLFLYLTFDLCADIARNRIKVVSVVCALVIFVLFYIIFCRNIHVFSDYSITDKYFEDRRFRQKRRVPNNDQVYRYRYRWLDNYYLIAAKRPLRSNSITKAAKNRDVVVIPFEKRDIKGYLLTLWDNAINLKGLK